MGDKLEITTFPKQHNVFYRVTNNALLFEVKCAENSILGLAKTPSPPCDIRVFFNFEKSRIEIGNQLNDRKVVHKPNILSSDVFRSFILVWNSDCIRLCTALDTEPLLAYKCATDHLMYVVFCVPGTNSQPARWKFELPPCSKLIPAVIPLNKPTPYWAKPGKTIPDDALIGGHENQPLYIMRAPHNGSLACGKLVPSTGLGYIAWGHLAHEKKEFEVLCGFNCIWVKSFQDKIPAGAVVAGHSEYMNLILYVGRAEHNGHLIPGKVQPSHKVCFIPYEGKEVPKEHFEVLVAVNESLYCSNSNINYTSNTINIEPLIVDMGYGHNRFEFFA